MLSSCDADITTSSSASEAFRTKSTTTIRCDYQRYWNARRVGFALISKIKGLSVKEGGDILAIALTAYARTEDRILALVSVFQMHSSKPFEPQELISAEANLTGRIINSE